MKKSNLCLILMLLMVSLAFAGSHVLENHTPTPSHMAKKNGFYEISSAADLLEFAQIVNAGESNAKACLLADIDMKDVAMQPIGFDGSIFRGTFAGGGHVIRNLNIAFPDNDFVGLFGLIGSGASISNFTLDSSCRIEGSAFVGVVGGTNEAGSILLENIGNEGAVYAVHQNAGGIIGCNFGSIATYTIRNCYVSGQISGELESAAISGWVGDNATVSYCYSIATLSGHRSNESFVRYGGNFASSNCYEQKDKGDQAVTVKVTRQQVENGELASLLNTNQDDLWRQNVGTDKHPVLLDGHTIVPGKDIHVDAVEIANAQDFVTFALQTAANPSLSARLTANIDLSGVTLPVIGSESQPYCGSFDGDGFVISNLRINSEGEKNVGLFSCIGPGAVLQDFTLDRSCRISGGTYVGLVGVVNGSVGDVYLKKVGNEGMVTAQNQNAGGLIGCVFSERISSHLTNCYVSGVVRGGLESAAISGWLNRGATLENCYSSAVVYGLEGDKTFYRCNSIGRCDNCYELDTYGRQDVTRKVNAQQLISGELTILLNHGDITPSSVWRQNLGDDRYPVLLSWHDVVTQVDNNISIDPSPQLSQLIINEVQSANVDIFVDPSFNYGGWIELYNPTDKTIELDHLYVSDDPSNPRLFELPDFFGSIPAKGYRNIWFDHNASEGDYGPDAYRQVSFKLDTEGGTIYLYDFNGQLLTSVTYPPAVARCSYARRSVDSDEWGMTSQPTPERSNQGVSFASQRLSSPQVSTEGRIFDTPFTFNVTVPEGATLRYTTDCSTPTLTNGQTSTDGHFSVGAQTTIYRFCLFQEDRLPSQVVTRSFIYRDRTYNLPVISVTTAEDNLFGDSLGVYVNGVNGVPGRGVGKSNINMDWERPVNFEYLLPDGTTAINQEATFHVAGGWNRHIYPQRSFKLKAEKQYEGQNSFDYPFFDSKPYNKYKMLLVRNGGNDTGAGRCQDGIIQHLIQSSGMYVDGQAWQPVQVLFNGGRYYAMMNLREASNKYFCSSNYGYDTDEVDVMELVSGSGLTPLSGDTQAFYELLGLSERASDAAVFEQIRERLDIDECASYMAAECYLGSWDWLTANNNMKVMRSRNDGRFHFVMYDVESAVDNSYADMWNNMSSNRNPVLTLFNNLCRNERFMRMFVDAYSLMDGSVFTRERLDEAVDWVKPFIAPALANEGLSPDHSINRLYGIIDTHADRLSCMRRYFGLGSFVDFSFFSNVTGASFMLNDMQVPTGKFKGSLLPPFELVASAPQGYRFVGWQSGDSYSRQPVFDHGSEWAYFDGDPQVGTSWVQPTFDDAAWKRGATPIGYSTKRNDCVTKTQEYLPAYYYRKKFDIASRMQEVKSVEFNITVDDGFVLYVNGAEAYRYLMPSGPVDYNTMATTYTSGDPDKLTITLDKSYFHQGENVIAVEVHNNILNSSDIHWNASLALLTSDAPILSTDRRIRFTDGSVGHVEAIFEKKADDVAVPLIVNEVSAKNDISVSEYFKKDDWFEIYNQTDEDIDLAGMYLSDKPNNWQKYCIPDDAGINTIVPAHGSLIVWADERTPLSQLHVPFKLSNSDGSLVSLTAADGSWSSTLQYLEHDSKSSFGRYPDGGGATYLMTRPTINKPNYLTTFDFNVLNTDLDVTKPSTLILSLSKGWNWFSHNLSEAVPVESFKSAATLIRSQYDELLLNESQQWTGGIRTLLPALGYKLKAAVDYEVTLQGDVFPVDDRDIRISAGWNWLGAPLAASTNTTYALTNFEASEGDRIVGIEGFAIYEDGQWKGSLDALVPGSAYMLWSAKVRSFKWNVLTQRKAFRRAASPASAATDAPWQADSHAYPDVMNIVASVSLNDSSEGSDGLLVGAFCGDECRGVATLHDGVCYLTVHGQDDDPIEFRIMTPDFESLSAQQMLTFVSLGSFGTTAAPYQLTVTYSDTITPVSPSGQPVSESYFTLDGKRITAPTHHSVRGVLLQRTLYTGGRVSTRKVVR